jgi:hypothetical protein
VSRPKTSKSIAAEIDRTFSANLRLLEESMAGLPKNCKAYLDRLLAKAKLQQQHRDERASRGLDPQNLGTAIKINYQFHSVIDAQPVEVDAKRQAFEDAMDAEFFSPAPPLPEPELMKTKTKRRK